MQVKFLHDHDYPSLKQVVGKVVDVVHSDNVTCMINGADLIAAGASQECFDSQWTYNFALGEDVEIVEDDHEG